MKLCMKNQKPKPFIFFLNYDPWLTLTYFMARSNFAKYGKCDNDGLFGHNCSLRSRIRLILLCQGFHSHSIQVLHRPRYHVSVYRTIGPLVII